MSSPTAHATLSASSKSNRRVFIGFREGVLDAFGPAGLTQVGALLSPQVRADTVDNSLTNEWYPRRYFDEWFTAVWEGPARRDQAQFDKFIQAMVEHGVNRFFRSLFRFLAPARFADAVVKQYKRDHTAGRLIVKVEGQRMQLNLHEMPFAPTPFNLMAVARSFHHGIALLSLADLQSAHELKSDGSLEIVMTWRAAA